MVVYDIETISTIKCVPYAKCIYRLSKNSGKYHRDQRKNTKNVYMIVLFVKD